MAAKSKEQLNYFTHVRTSFETMPRLVLSQMLAELAPGDLKRVNYCLHASNAIEGAMKLAMREYPDRKFFLAPWDSFSGRTLAGISLSYPHPWPFATTPAIPCTAGLLLSLPYDAPTRLRPVLREDDAHIGTVDGQPVAFIMEPIQASGGMIDFPKPYHQAIREMCDKYDMLLIWDEVQTGFGRLGTMFASELYETVPDILCFGKA
jgi:acetylornithine/succinyldiaminopimelate/putrescine aminotransferase